MIVSAIHFIKKIPYILVVIVCCLTGCGTTDDNVVSEASSDIKVSSGVPLGSSATLSDSSTTSLENSVPAQENSQETPIAITPSENIPASEIPQPDGVPHTHPSGSSDEMTKDGVYEPGKITITRVQIDGTSEIMAINDNEAKKLILDYVDTMQSSEYNAMNTPPGGGRIISVAVHRDEVIELYAFSDDTVDGNALGKNYQDSDVTKWYIVNENAFAFLIDLFSCSN